MKATLRMNLSGMIAAVALLVGLALPTQAQDRVNVILDTDMASDVDDAGALVTLLNLEDLGEVNVLAVGVSMPHNWSALCVDAITTYYGRPDIPIGTVKKSVLDHGSRYAEGIATEYPRSRGWNSIDDVPEVIGVYREVLAQQPDNSEDDSRHGYVGYTGFRLDPNGLQKMKNQNPDTFNQDMIASELYELMKRNPYGKEPGDPRVPLAAPPG